MKRSAQEVEPFASLRQDSSAGVCEGALEISCKRFGNRRSELEGGLDQAAEVGEGVGGGEVGRLGSCETSGALGV